MVQRMSPVPPYRQVYEIIRGQIQSGELPPGSVVPSLAALVQTYEINRSTAHKVHRALVADGLVETGPMGTFVI